MELAQYVDIETVISYAWANNPSLSRVPKCLCGFMALISLSTLLTVYLVRILTFEHASIPDRS